MLEQIVRNRQSSCYGMQHPSDPRSQTIPLHLHLPQPVSCGEVNPPSRSCLRRRKKEEERERSSNPSPLLPTISGASERRRNKRKKA
ncbi:hypothetical protein CDAR_242241 [Caerostris darwini]|uniref:Uncharacterized protein n=1 Tax=Caerostris darwini TaxID=1538125 RepID=A0AAV4NMD0_9ARAC|nr:hypothetical protein CDAR_242241 [Caerostris darwini]